VEKAQSSNPGFVIWSEAEDMDTSRALSLKRLGDLSSHKGTLFLDDVGDVPLEL
jgi:hypothetical protein